MKRITFLFLTVIVAFVLISSSCSQQHNESASESMSLKFTDDNFSVVINQIKADPTMSQEELALFSKGLIRINGNLDSLNGKTVGEIVQLQKDFLRKSAMTQMLNTSMNMNHAFGLMGWEPVIHEGKEFDVFKYALQNKSKKDIKLIEGYLKFFTSNNQLIRVFPIKVLQTIGVDSTQQFQSTFPYDSTKNSANMLRKLMKNKSGNAIPVWQPITIIFGDDSSISIIEEKKDEETTDEGKK